MTRSRLQIPAFDDSLWQMPVADFLHMGQRERALVVESMRREVRARASEFNKRGLYSYGLESLKENLSHIGVSTTKQVITATKGLGVDFRNRASERAINTTLLQAFAQYKQFFDPHETATSSVEGILEVNRQQDILIFGADNEGNPIKSMTTKQRRRMWAVVDAIRASDLINPADEYFYRSEGFQNLFFSDKFTYASAAKKTQMLVDYFEKRRGEVPPTQPVEGDDVEDANRYDALVKDLYEKFSSITKSRSK